MRARLHRFALRCYQRLPVLGRRWVVRTIAPSYTVGAICIIERADGALLFVRHSYRSRWGVPGGLLNRREEPEHAALREVREEVGLEVVLLGEPVVVVDARPQRVDLVYRARPAPGADLAEVRPVSAEIAEVRWFVPDQLPQLQTETTGALMAIARAANEPRAGWEVA